MGMSVCPEDRFFLRFIHVNEANDLFSYNEPERLQLAQLAHAIV